MAVYGYSRVSTLAQAEDGQSLETQSRTIAGYAMMHGLTLDETFVERGVSGSVALSDRDEGKKLLALLRPGDVVITPKLDRMFRSARDALEVLDSLKRRGVALHMIDLGGDVTSNGISKLVFTILSAVAEAERDRIRERITTVKADQKARGMFLGGRVPFGFKRVPLTAEEIARVAETGKKLAGRLEQDEGQQTAISYMRAAREDGKTLQSIQADVLRMFGHKLSLDAVCRVLREKAAA